MTRFKERYGQNALVAGGSEGLGAAFAHALASRGLNLFLIARREEQLNRMADEIRTQYSVEVKTIVCDLSSDDAFDNIKSELRETPIDFLVYNAAQPFIGKFESADIQLQTGIIKVNVLSVIQFTHYFGSLMVNRNRGGIILMSSLSGRQGSPYISTYAATKAFNQVLGEGLWFEWKKKKVDVLACVAGATATPNFIKSNPKPLGLIEPQVQSPESVVKECFKKLGKKPSFIPGRGNRVATFFMKMFSRKFAINVMGNSVKKMYGISD